MFGKFCAAATAAAGFLFGGIGAASAAVCTPISSAADLDLIRNDLAGVYCLTQDIQLSGNFTPIGSLLAAQPFTGVFDGQGHVIRGLKIGGVHDVGIGFFSWVHGGRVKNLTLAAVTVRSKIAVPVVGAVAGFVTGNAEINNVHVTGTVECDECRVGGIVGELGNAELRNSSSTASVKAAHGGAAGGAVGQMGGNAVRSFATGRVTCASHCVAGGFIGEFSGGLIMQSFAAGRVQQGRGGIAGGLVGRGTGRIAQSYSTSAVGVITSTAGGLAGSSDDTREAFAVGRVSGNPGSFLGGLTATAGLNTTAAYWDTSTTRQIFSATGSPSNTNQLRRNLPAGFSDNWGITRGYSYPYLDVPGLGFSASLATVVNANSTFTFLPIDQHEWMEYGGKARNADAASLAVVYTMIARAIGTTRLVPQLEAVLIDRYFWDDATRTARWIGPVTNHADLLPPLIVLPPETPISNKNITGALKRGDLVILRGGAATSPEKHWMLATLFRTNDMNVPTHIVANDPWTGKQVLIDVTTRRVTSAGFPLKDFKVDAYQLVRLKEPPR